MHALMRFVVVYVNTISFKLPVNADEIRHSRALVCKKKQTEGETKILSRDSVMMRRVVYNVTGQ